jgi:hypothetical protein
MLTLYSHRMFTVSDSLDIISLHVVHTHHPYRVRGRQVHEKKHCSLIQDSDWSVVVMVRRMDVGSKYHHWVSRNVRGNDTNVYPGMF